MEFTREKSCWQKNLSSLFTGENIVHHYACDSKRRRRTNFHYKTKEILFLWNYDEIQRRILKGKFKNILMQLMFYFHEFTSQNFSLQYQYSIKHTSDEN